MNQQEQNETSDIKFLSNPDWKDYQLLDSGDGRKLERYGPYRLIRPEVEAIWRPALAQSVWDSAQATFMPGSETHGGHWKFAEEIPDRWTMVYRDLKFWVQTSASRHLGIFPEQAVQWDWIIKQIGSVNRPVKVLNLFGYTGIASLAAASAGAIVTHLDASQKVLSWAKDNQQVSGLAECPIRWIKDDALKFTKREARRQNKYDGLILDPPKFGRGPQGEVWDFYKLIPSLLDTCRQVLSVQPVFVLITAYAVKASAMTLYHAVDEMMETWQGDTVAGEVALTENSRGRKLSLAIFARWSANEK
ncbi:MAG: class I SAM-dependent methyltransferase [Anaerolineaceae bacterium]|nr:class I SAM-dependent methyltransferase [Anaerolineaceae bacterium]